MRKGPCRWNEPVGGSVPWWRGNNEKKEQKNWKMFQKRFQKIFLKKFQKIFNELFYILFSGYEGPLFDT